MTGCGAELFLRAGGPAAVPLRACCAAALLEQPGQIRPAPLICRAAGPPPRSAELAAGLAGRPPDVAAGVTGRPPEVAAGVTGRAEVTAGPAECPR